MEDSSWEGWTTPPSPEGFALGYPEGRKLPGGPPGGWVGQFRTTTAATDDASSSPRACWTQVQAEDFERDGRRYVDRATGIAYDLCPRQPDAGRRRRRGRPVLRRGRRALVPAPERPVAGAEQVDRLDGRDPPGAAMRHRPQPGDLCTASDVRAGLRLVPFGLLGTPGLGAGRGQVPAARQDAPASGPNARVSRRVPPVPRHSVPRRRKASARCARSGHRRLGSRR